MYWRLRVPSKVFEKTPYKLWTWKKPNLKHFHVWGYPAELSAYNTYERKLDAKNISSYFINYSEKFKGYKFYCPKYCTKIVESNNAQFIENGQVGRSLEPQKVVIQEILAETL